MEFFYLMRVTGLEPARRGHQNLNPKNADFIVFIRLFQSIISIIYYKFHLAILFLMSIYSSFDVRNFILISFKNIGNWNDLFALLIQLQHTLNLIILFPIYVRMV